MSKAQDQIEPASVGDALFDARDLAKFPSENPNPVLRVDHNGILLYANQASVALLEEWVFVQGQRAPDPLRTAVLDALERDSRTETEATHSGRVYSLSIAPIKESGYANIYGLDITARVQSENKMRQALSEREVLIRELYHRTKNNMNIISSMIALSAAQSGDPHVQRLAGEIADKISAMALVHQKLYQSQNLASIEFDEYIRDLVELFTTSYRDQQFTLATELALTPTTITIEVATPMGLVLSELFMNSLKHAFPERRSGVVGIELYCPDCDLLRLAYYDDGVGAPQGFDFRNQPTLGIQTVLMIVEDQLRGTVTFGRGPGFRCDMEIPSKVKPPKVLGEL